MSEKNEAVFGSDVKRLPVSELAKRIGPGLIATGIVIGPGAVTTSAMLGASYGYALIWLIIPIIFMGEGYKKPTALRICMTISYIFVLIMTVSSLSNQLPRLFHSLGF